NQAEHIAHAQYPGSHPVRIEGLYIIELLACCCKLDRLSRHCLHRECSSASCISIQLGEYDTVDSQLAVEIFGDIYRILPGHRVNHQQYFVRMDSIFYV